MHTRVPGCSKGNQGTTPSHIFFLFISRSLGIREQTCLYPHGRSHKQTFKIRNSIALGTRVPNNFAGGFPRYPDRILQQYCVIRQWTRGTGSGFVVSCDSRQRNRDLFRHSFSGCPNSGLAVVPLRNSLVCTQTYPGVHNFYFCIVTCADSQPDVLGI